MERPVVKETETGRWKTYVRLRDYALLVNAERLDINDASIFEAVEHGQSRVFAFIFRTRPEFESFANRYAEASLLTINPSNGEDGSDSPDDGSDFTNGASEAEEDDGEDNSAAIDGESQDLMQLYYSSAAATKAMKGLAIQSSIEEEDAESSSS